MIRRAWAAAADWLEKGDLVPLMIAVSAYHYIRVLWGDDPWPVAVLVGVLVDLGHYRTVKIAARYTGKRKHVLIGRWVVALAMTAVSLSYHWRFYDGDWWLAAPMPVLIAVLAYFQRHGYAEAFGDTKEERTIAEDDAEDAQSERSGNGRAPYWCEACEMGFDSPQAYAGHCRGAEHKQNASVIGGKS